MRVASGNVTKRAMLPELDCIVECFPSLTRKRSKLTSSRWQVEEPSALRCIKRIAGVVHSDKEHNFFGVQRRNGQPNRAQPAGNSDEAIEDRYILSNF